MIVFDPENPTANEKNMDQQVLNHALIGIHLKRASQGERLKEAFKFVLSPEGRRLKKMIDTTCYKG